MAKAAEAAGADALSLINTITGMKIDIHAEFAIANKTGGMSGPGMFPLAVRMVYQVYEAVHIPTVGMGGVTSAQDVLELMLAGATAVGVGAANLVEPYACKHIIETLPDAMARFGIDNLRDIIGGAHHGKDVIIALDFDSREKTLAFLDLFQDEKPFVKIGMELFYAEGPDIVRQIHARGHRIFLDLKLHDIPNTVKKAMAALSALDVDIINLHAAGTKP